MKVLALDVELSPLMAYVWGLYNVDSISLDQMRESQEVICFGAKWVGGDYVFRSVYHHGKTQMLTALHQLLDEADVVLGWNSRNFDMKHVQREFIENGYPPPSPVKHIDLMLVARKEFRFPSNKLEYVSRKLLGVGKVDNGGFKTWLACLTGTDKEKHRAWARMKKYQKQDVLLLEPLYEKMRPWLNGPHQVGKALTAGITSNDQACPNCGSVHFQRRGMEHTKARSYHRLQCQDCRTWWKGELIKPVLNLEGTNPHT